MDIKQLIESGIIEKYVLGLASQEEMNLVEKMTKEYPEINRHICKMQNCMQEYAEMNDVRPPKHSDEKPTLDPSASSIALQQNTQKLPQSRRWGAILSTIMIIAFGGLSWMFYNSQKSARQEINLLSTQIKHLQSEQNALLTSDLKVRERYAILKDVTTQQVHLRSTDSVPKINAVVYVNPGQGKCFLNVNGMPESANGHEYHMWAEVDGKHVNLGVLKTDSTDMELHSIPCIKGCKGFVITLVKEGGSALPTVENVYAYGGM